jgi:hypothetical protein
MSLAGFVVRIWLLASDIRTGFHEERTGIMGKNPVKPSGGGVWNRFGHRKVRISILDGFCVITAEKTVSLIFLVNELPLREFY